MLVIHRQFKKMITAAKYLERKKDKSREETAALRSFNSMVISVCSIAFILILAVMVMLFFFIISAPPLLIVKSNMAKPFSQWYKQYNENNKY